jgi:hypothetical protein
VKDIARRVEDDDPVNDQVIEISFRQPPRQFGGSQVNAYGYRLFKDGGAQVEGFDNPSYSDVLTEPMEQPTGLDEKGQYNLDLKTYYWIDVDEDGLEPLSGIGTKGREVFYSRPSSVRLVVEWD